MRKLFKKNNGNLDLTEIGVSMIQQMKYLTGLQQITFILLTSGDSGEIPLDHGRKRLVTVQEFFESQNDIFLLDDTEKSIVLNKFVNSLQFHCIDPDIKLHPANLTVEMIQPLLIDKKLDDRVIGDMKNFVMGDLCTSFEIVQKVKDMLDEKYEEQRSKQKKIQKKELLTAIQVEPNCQNV